MWRRRIKDPDLGKATLAVAFGMTAGAAVYLAWRRSRAHEPELLPAALARIETGTVSALSDDEIAGRRGIEVAALGSGIIELSGTVQDIEEARRAVDVAHGVDGVHTVINRLELAGAERHLAETRDRLRAGDAALSETRVYGMGVGMGRRRQSPETDPDRPDDHVRSVTRALEPDAVEEYLDQAD